MEAWAKMDAKRNAAPMEAWAKMEQETRPKRGVLKEQAPKGQNKQIPIWGSSCFAQAHYV